MNKNVVAFVFARGGSKGLPNKNILEIDSIPLIGHALLQAKAAGIENVYVSSDSELILETAKKYGAKLIKRPPELATDTSSELDAWKHAINYVFETHPFNIFISLPCTAPLRIADDITNSLNLLDENTDLVITVTEANRNPYFNMVTMDSNGICKVVIDDCNFQRRQDAPKIYDVTTVAYVSRPNYILSTNQILSGIVKAHVVPKERSIDIDDKIDFIIAKKIYEIKNDG